MTQVGVHHPLLVFSPVAGQALIVTRYAKNQMGGLVTDPDHEFVVEWETLEAVYLAAKKARGEKEAPPSGRRGR